MMESEQENHDEMPADIPDGDNLEEISFDIQLNTVPDETNFHRMNADDIQRPEILDSECIGLKISGSLFRVIHGIDNFDNQNKPASLIVLGLRFHGATQKRRLRSVTVDIIFQGESPERQGNFYDPEVVAFWPEERASLEETVVGIGKSVNVSGNISVGFGGASVGVESGVEHEKTFSKITRATVEVAGGLGPSRSSGRNNMVSITLNENDDTMGGLPDIRIPILLNRKNNDDKFIATIAIKGQGGFKHNFASSLKKIVGRSPVNHPVTFDPHQPPWTRRATVEDKQTWAREVLPEDLGDVELENFWKASFFSTR